MSLKQLFPTVLAWAVLLGACSQAPEEATTTEAGEQEEVVAVPVEVGRPTRGDIVAVYSGTAPIEAYAEADVIAKVSGEVREILVEEGDEVSKSQTMASARSMNSPATRSCSLTMELNPGVSTRLTRVSSSAG